MEIDESLTASLELPLVDDAEKRYLGAARFFTCRIVIGPSASLD